MNIKSIFVAIAFLLGSSAAALAQGRPAADFQITKIAKT